MSFLDTKNKKKSFTITVVLMILLLLIMFVTGMTRFDPPIENGIAVNLGYMDTGSGDVQPMEKVKVTPQPTPSQPQEEVAEEEEVLTSEEEDVPVVPTAEKKEEEKPKEETPKSEKPKVKEKPKPDKSTTETLGGILGAEAVDGKEENGQGPGNGPGDIGKEGGDPYATAVYGPGNGKGSGGRGWGLNGRGTPTFQSVKQDCNESGTVVVRIVVNKAGNVIEARSGERGTTNTATCLAEPAEKIAKSYKWPRDDNAPEKQIGFVVVKFDLGE
ncbi:energy transducer TonB [Neptunitalea lumnitzerae]|nr:energy transducer TonB [Neptunitalea sp. Y10]